MSYVYSSDPRLKRQASTSPDDAPRDSKRPATFAIRETLPAVENNHGVAQSNGVVATPTRVAETGKKAQNSPIVDLKMQINLQTVTTMNLQLKFESAETQVKAAQADYQSHANKNHFTVFPALKETKTAAVERAKKAAGAAQQPLESARCELHRLMESLVDLEQSRQAPVQDAKSHDELEELRRELNGIKTDVSGIIKDLQNARETIDSCKADQTVANKAIEEFRRNNDSQATRTDADHSTLSAPLDAGITERLDAVESDVKDLESDISNVNKAVAEWVLEALKAPNNAVVELQDGLQNNSITIAELRMEVKRTEEETGQLRDALTKGVDDQHTNAETLQGCLDRLDKMEHLVEQAADKATLHAVKNSLQQLGNTVESINTSQQKSVNAAKQTTTNGVNSGLSSFQPILGGDDQDDINPFHSRPAVLGTHRKFDDNDLLHMKIDIEGLKYRVQDQTNRYNNLQTDQLAQNMLDNLGAVYPNLKEAERVTKTVHDLNGRLGSLEARFNEVSQRTGSISNRIDVLDAKAVAADHAIGQDMSKMHGDIAALSGRVDRHTKDVEAGRLQLHEHAAAIEKSKDDLKGIETWITNRG